MNVDMMEQVEDFLKQHPEIRGYIALAERASKIDESTESVLTPQLYKHVKATSSEKEKYNGNISGTVRWY